jgi:hypothetical protein
MIDLSQLQPIPLEQMTDEELVKLRDSIKGETLKRTIDEEVARRKVNTES